MNDFSGTTTALVPAPSLFDDLSDVGNRVGRYLRRLAQVLGDRDAPADTHTERWSSVAAPTAAAASLAPAVGTGAVRSSVAP